MGDTAAVWDYLSEQCIKAWEQDRADLAAARAELGLARKQVQDLTEGRDDRFIELETLYYKTSQLYTQAMTEKTQLRNRLDDVRRALQADADL